MSSYMCGIYQHIKHVSISCSTICSGGFFPFSMQIGKVREREQSIRQKRISSGSYERTTYDVVVTRPSTHTHTHGEFTDERATYSERKYFSSVLWHGFMVLFNYHFKVRTCSAYVLDQLIQILIVFVLFFLYCSVLLAILLLVFVCSN